MSELGKRKLNMQIEDTRVDIKKHRELLLSLVGTLYLSVVLTEIRGLAIHLADLENTLRKWK